MAVVVIDFPLLRIPQDFVSLGGLFKPLHRFPIPRIPIRMILHCQSPVGSLDLLFSRIPFDAEDFVIVSFRHFDFLVLSQLVDRKGSRIQVIKGSSEMIKNYKD